MGSDDELLLTCALTEPLFACRARADVGGGRALDGLSVRLLTEATAVCADRVGEAGRDPDLGCCDGCRELPCEGELFLLPFPLVHEPDLRSSTNRPLMGQGCGASFRLFHSCSKLD